MDHSELTVTPYSDRSVVVRGNTKLYKEQLENIGGKYNGNLTGGPGWIFSHQKLLLVLTFISSLGAIQQTVSYIVSLPVVGKQVKVNDTIFNITEATSDKATIHNDTIRHQLLIVSGTWRIVSSNDTIDYNSIITFLP